MPGTRAPGEVASLADSIFQPPGFVSVDGCVFDLRAEGVYRFYRLPRLSEQRIVWHGDLDSLLSMLGYLWVHGSLDNNAIAAEPHVAYTAVRRRVMVATCTPLARLAVTVLAAADITARPVALITLDRWGGHDDGHTLVEISSSEAGWFLYDPSYNVCIVEGDRRLNLLETVESLKSRKATFQHLPGNSGHEIHRKNNYDFGFFADEKRASNVILYDWYCRLAGVPIIFTKQSYAFASDGLDTSDLRRLSRRYSAMSRRDFLYQFYSTGST